LNKIYICRVFPDNWDMYSLESKWKGKTAGGSKPSQKIFLLISLIKHGPLFPSQKELILPRMSKWILMINGSTTLNSDSRLPRTPNCSSLLCKKIRSYQARATSQLT